MRHESKKPRLFAVSMDGSATKVTWQSEFSDPRLAACDLYERALDIEAADHLPISFRREDDGSYIAAIYQKTLAPGQLENVLCMIFDLNDDQKDCLKDFSIFVRRSQALRPVPTLSRIRAWQAARCAEGPGKKC